jgi:hypothetical protein
MGVEYVNFFVEMVYSALCTADTADYSAGCFSSVVNRMGKAGATDAELRRYRKGAAPLEGRGGGFRWGAVRVSG